MSWLQGRRGFISMATQQAEVTSEVALVIMGFCLRLGLRIGGANYYCLTYQHTTQEGDAALPTTIHPAQCSQSNHQEAVNCNHQAGNGWERLGTAGNGWERLGTVGNGWERLGTVGNGWERLGTVTCAERRLLLFLLFLPPTQPTTTIVVVAVAGVPLSLCVCIYSL
jgi:hypothetical protein